MEKLERINKYLSEAGVCSRRDVDELIETGRVEVNGSPARIGMQINTELDKVTVDGQRVDLEHPANNAIDPNYVIEDKTPWWEERQQRRDAAAAKLQSNPKSKLLRKGKKQSAKLDSSKGLTKGLTPAEKAQKEARKAERKQAKSFGEALSDKQDLMNVKTRRIENAVNPKAAKLRETAKKKVTPRRK